MSSEAKLLPCPFCGAEGEMCDNGLLPELRYYVMCKECNAKTDDDYDYPTIEDATRKWNTRAEPQGAPRELLANAVRGFLALFNDEGEFEEQFVDQASVAIEAGETAALRDAAPSQPAPDEPVYDPEADKCAGGVKVPPFAACPKCGATDDDSCPYEAALTTAPKEE